MEDECPNCAAMKKEIETLHKLLAAARHRANKAEKKAEEVTSEMNWIKYPDKMGQ